MSSWCMAHPWMTFWLIVITLGIAHDMNVAICRTAIARKRQSQEQRSEKP